MPERSRARRLRPLAATRAAPPRVVDAAVAAAFLVAGTLQLALDEREAPLALNLVMVVSYTVPLAFRRRAPLAVAVWVIATVIVYAAVVPEGRQALIPFALLLVAYTGGAHLRPPRDWLALAAVAGGLTAAVIAAGEPADAPFAAILTTGAWAFGRALRLRAVRADAEAGAAAAEERARIARELHDIVSHAISAVVVHTQVVQQRLGDDPARDREDLRRMEGTARQAMAEMRRLFGVLRAGDGPAALAPQPGLDQLDVLLDDARAAGLAVEAGVEGDRVALPAGLDLTAYRIVQEALTNVRRHADAGSASVRLGFGARDLTILVEDDGHGARANGHAPGHGLAGMRERVALYGGTLETGDRPGGGFLVRARLPLREDRTA